MSDAVALRLIHFGLRMMNVSLILLGPKIWPWLPGRVPERGSTFFGVRVLPDFAGSEVGRDILRIFRRRVWMGTFALAAIYGVAAPSGPAMMFQWFSAALLGSWVVSWVLYAVAQRQTRIEAGPAREPSVRTATLLSESRPQPRWMALVAWTVMIVPIAMPLVTGILLAWNWPQYPARFHPEWVPPQIGIAACFGLLMTGMQYALRFHARASDWAATPESSLKYRTYLGLMMGASSLGVIFWICIQCLAPLYHAGMGIVFGLLFPLLFATVVVSQRTKSKLEKLFDPQSVDPMADKCWKWTHFYCNKNDPAWIVPTRSGISCSLNLARPMVWAAYGLMVVGTAVSLLFVVRLMPVIR